MPHSCNRSHFSWDTLTLPPLHLPLFAMLFVSHQTIPVYFRHSSRPSPGLTFSKACSPCRLSSALLCHSILLFQPTACWRYMPSGVTRYIGSTPPAFHTLRRILACWRPRSLLIFHFFGENHACPFNLDSQISRPSNGSDILARNPNLFRWSTITSTVSTSSYNRMSSISELIAPSYPKTVSLKFHLKGGWYYR